MLCPRCGKPVPNGARFCDRCGAPIIPQRSRMPLPQGIFFCQDGKYRWAYELNYWKNPTIFLTLCKVMGGTALLAALLLALMRLDEGILSAVVMFGLSLVIAVPIALAISGLGYVLTGFINGGKYCVIFTMDEEKIVHAQAPKQVEKGRAIALLHMMVSREPSVGLMTWASEKYTSVYRDVKTLCLESRRDLIRLNETLVKNQIYAEPHQYPFVADYLIRHCRNAEIKGR